MAHEEALICITVPANSDLSALQYKLVTVNSSGRAALAGAGLAADGVLQNNPDAAERPAAVASVPGTVSKVYAGAAVARGALVTPDSSGRAVTAGTGDVVAGKALAAASGVGSIIPVLLKLQSEPLA